MKKLGKIALALVMSLSLVGCQKGDEDPNAKRSTEHAYDYINFIDVYTYGTNGNGFIQVEPKALDVSMFDDEQEYIRVKKMVDDLQLYITPGKDQSTYLMADKSTELSNGEIVTLGLSSNYKGDFNGLDVNTEPYYLTIANLPEASNVDLFDSSSIEFFGLEGTSEVYSMKKENGVVPNEILEQLEYTVKPQDKVLEAGKTVLDVSASADKKFLEENQFYTTEIFLGRSGLATSTSGQKVLMNVVSPIDFENDDVEGLKEEILEKLQEQKLTKNEEEFSAVDIGTIQQQKDTKDKYTYTVVYKAESVSRDITLKTTVKVANLNGNFVVINIASNPETTDSRFLQGDPYRDMEVLYLNSIFQPEPEIVGPPAEDLDPEKVQEVEIANLEQETDLEVKFTFDKEFSDVDFISPDNTVIQAEKTEGQTEDGKFWRNYKISNAKAGVWKAQYKLQGNQSVVHELAE